MKQLMVLTVVLLVFMAGCLGGGGDVVDEHDDDDHEHGVDDVHDERGGEEISTSDTLDETAIVSDESFEDINAEEDLNESGEFGFGLEAESVI